MATGAPSTAGKDLTPKAFAAWTLVMTLMLAICLSGVLARVGPAGFTIGFLPTFVLVFALSWTGRFDRLLLAALATLLVALWPLYRWLAHGDVETARIYLFVAGFINAMLLMSTAQGFANRRGWVVDSPVRRRLLAGSMVVYFISTVTGWPTGAWRTGLLVVWWAVFLSGFFWPARRRPPQPNQAVTA